jgi:vacuolar-type H+-ATPase subunit E/Vma4
MTEMDKVSIKVLEDARSTRSDNIREAEEKAAGILAEASKKVREKTTRAKTEAEQHYRKVFDLEVFKARSALDQKVLIVKLELVEDVIEKAKDRLSGLDRKGWEKFLRKMAAELRISEGKYQVGRKEKVLDGSLVSVIKGIKPDDKKANFDSGLMITGKRAEILLSPGNYLDTDIEDLKMEVASYLFGGEK